MDLEIPKSNMTMQIISCLKTWQILLSATKKKNKVLIGVKPQQETKQNYYYLLNKL